MTTVDIVFRYDIPPDERIAVSVNRMREIYGVRKITLDEKESTIGVEYDATRLDATEIANLLRNAGLDLKERVQLV